ncbi:hypothetical protein VTP01DRAFT_7992 [Rhizomucor pusillus]|uniref:uncharacterized protein n=1 Tax=Rhizomucor pusillus TaxID=4840 RepID=UPI00374206FF
MATLFFEDYNFPGELYNRHTSDFSTPIRTLLDFTPHILQELPKNEKDQKPIHPKQDHSAEFLDKKKKASSSSRSRSNHYSEYLRYAEGFGRFLADCCIDYLATRNARAAAQGERYDSIPRTRTNKRRRFYAHHTHVSTEDDSEDEEEQEKQQKERKSNNSREKKEKGNSEANIVYAKSAAAVGALTLSLYSTYKASAVYGDVTFHDQLELLLEHVQTVLKSSEIWIEEHEKMGDPVPSNMRLDINRLNQLVDHIQRLDPRYEKKLEVTGWSLGAIGGLSALGGIAVGSAAFMSGGAVIAVGGVMVLITSKARYSSKSTTAARILLESKVRQLLQEFTQAAPARQQMIQQGFQEAGIKAERMDVDKSYRVKHESVEETASIPKAQKNSKHPLAA